MVNDTVVGPSFLVGRLSRSKIETAGALLEKEAQGAIDQPFAYGKPIQVR